MAQPRCEDPGRARGSRDSRISQPQASPEAAAAPGFEELCAPGTGVPPGTTRWGLLRAERRARPEGTSGRLGSQAGWEKGGSCSGPGVSGSLLGRAGESRGCGKAEHVCVRVCARARQDVCIGRAPGCIWTWDVRLKFGGGTLETPGGSGAVFLWL